MIASVARGALGVLLGGLAGCTDPPPPAPDSPAPPHGPGTLHGAPMQDVDLVVGDDALAVHLAGAWVGPDGSGHGTETRAEAPGPPPLVVTGGRSEWKLADGVVVFEQAVTATRHDVTITCDRLEVRYSGDRVEEATATGHVRVARGARAATGERATLTVADGRVVLEGSPTLTEGPNRMTGERIVLWLDDERLECDRCRLEVRGDAVAPGAPPR